MSDRTGELTALRRAVRAIGGLDDTVLTCVTPE